MRNWLNQQEEISVIMDTDNISDFILSAESNLPDVVIFDTSSHDGTILDAIRYLHDYSPLIRVLVIANNFRNDGILNMLDLGVNGFLNSNSDPAELIDAIKTVGKGQTHRNKILTDALYFRTSHKGESFAEQAAFNDKQKRLLQLLWEEKNTNEIAAEIFLSASAVEKMKQRMKEIVGAKTSIGLIKYGLDNKLI
jgi:two-component system nitrate/nitrite response regulator NarL